MKELVEVIAKALVDNPDEVVVTESEKEEEIVIELKVAPTDMGTVSYTHLDLDFDEVLQAIAKKFKATAKFWGAAQMTLTLEGRDLTPEEEYRVVQTITENSDIEAVSYTHLDVYKRQGWIRETLILIEKRSSCGCLRICAKETLWQLEKRRNHGTYKDVRRAWNL